MFNMRMELKVFSLVQDTMEMFIGVNLKIVRMISSLCYVVFVGNVV